MTRSEIIREMVGCSLDSGGAKYTKAPPEVRFWRFVDKKAADECWYWTGQRTPHGYGLFKYESRSISIRAHRYSYIIATGETLTSADHICHHCDNPPCVNPNHLFRGSVADNMQDMAKKGRHHLGSRASCKHGHPYTPEGTRINARGYRECRTCDAAKTRRYRAEKRAAQ